MEFKNTNVYNFEGAFRGMRNPMNSWDRSDSYFGIVNFDYLHDSNVFTDICDAWIDYKNIERSERNLELYGHDMTDYNEYYEILEACEDWLMGEGVLSRNDNYEDFYNVAFLGPNDLHLAQQLICAGAEHAKFTRQIFVSVDITAPLYWWKEFDTYKVGTVANSTSTMHKLSSIPITKEIFDFDYIDDPSVEAFKTVVINGCEGLREKFKETGDASYWRALVQILPNAYLQTRTVTMSYANLRNIYFQRKNHKLKEWHQFCDEWITSLPYASELITMGGNK